jgi:hypothetical protein
VTNLSNTLSRPVKEQPRATTGLRLDPVGRRRRPALAIGSLALVIACVAIFVSVYLSAGRQVAVLAMAKAVPQGQVVQISDLTTVRLSAGPGIDSMPASRATDVIGRRAAQILEPGTLLTENDLVTRYAPPAGESIVGVSLKEGQLPASGVAPGETVDVVLTEPQGEQESVAASPSIEDPATSTPGAPVTTAGTVLVADATVLDASSPTNDSGTVDVSLLTGTALAPLVASASAAGQVALIVVAPGS